MLTPAQWAADQRAPTMDAMFPPSGIAMQHPIIVWWLVVEALGAIAFPFTFVFLSRFPDRGFVIAKTIGLLMAGYVVWIAASVGLALYDRGFLWLAVGALAVLSAILVAILRREIFAFIRREWRRVLTGEAVFLAGFVLFVLLRMWYPDLGHQFSPVSPSNLGDGRMGEKQMELAFLNAVVRSRVFPPYDPFFAHGYINYYYYGFVLVGTLCKLAQIAPATGFNLAIATFFAMLVGNTFSVVQALTRRVTPGIIAAIFVGAVGNLNGAWQVIRGLMAVSQVHSAFPVLGGIVDVLSGLQQAIIARQALPPFDFWEPTRIVPPAGITISEFPYFTYLFADLHPHLMAFPMTIVALALGVNLLLSADSVGWRLALSVAIGSIVLGAIIATNPWDFPTYLAVVALGAAVGAFARRRRLDWSVLIRPTFWLVALAILSFILYLPFERSYQTVFTTGVGLVRNVRPDSLQGLCQGNPQPCSQILHETLVTPLHIYLEQFGLFLFILVSYLAVLLSKDAGGWRRWRQWMTRAQFALYYRDRLTDLRRAGRIVRRMRGPQEAVVDGSLLLGLAIVVVGLTVFADYLLAFLVLVIGLTALLLLRLNRKLSEPQLFLLVLLLVPIALSLVTQVFYIKDFLDGSPAFRMNTIFKFYNQAWVLYAVTASCALYYIVAREGTPPAVRQPVVRDAVLVGADGDTDPADPRAPVLPDSESDASIPLSGWQRAHRFTDRHAVWTAVLLILVAGSLVYTYAGTIARETYRQSWLPERSVPLTLDGMAFMRVAYPGDYAGITWLNAHVAGTPVIAEAYDPSHGYTWYSRVSMFTGLPDVINGIHEGEQRFGDELDPSSLCSRAPSSSTCLERLHSRADDVQMLYASARTTDAWHIIREYGIRYIYVGFSERQRYPARGLAKFRTMTGHGLAVAFHRRNTTIYQVTRP